MNIFATSPCPIKSATYLQGKRATKMVLESAQLLSTALRVHGYEGDKAYKKTHLNHPCTKWVCESRENYKWLLDHFKALSEHFTKRSGKIHKSSLLYEELSAKMDIIPQGNFTMPPNCASRNDMGFCYKHIENVTLAYKIYLDVRRENV